MKPPIRRRVLFVSPHLDDAVFSCAARMLREAEAGSEVTVATVFSHVRRGSPESHAYLRRREEDLHALQLLGAKPRWLGLIDAPSRKPFYDSFRRIVLSTAPGDAGQVERVHEVLSPVLKNPAPDAVYLPLAVGNHIDHRLVFAAGLTLRLKCPHFFYEDQPYAWVRHAARLRLRELRVIVSESDADEIPRPETNPGWWPEYLKSFRAASYVRRYLSGAAERRTCEQLLREKLTAMSPPLELRLVSELEPAPAAERPRIIRAMFAYRSQASTFLGPRQQVGAKLRRHARDLGSDAWRVERYWRWS